MYYIFNQILWFEQKNVCLLVILLIILLFESVLWTLNVIRDIWWIICGKFSAAVGVSLFIQEFVSK